MTKLWEKDYRLEALLEAFTVGDDWQVDARLVGADCVASMAHAAMLHAVGLLTRPELDGLQRELLAIADDAWKGSFSIAPSDEDCHTAIENRLVAALGDTGKKIHTGRSRNDQVLAALRLWTRDYLLAFESACLALADRLLDFAERHADVPMPGRTHLQPAMPSSVGLWSAAHAEELIDDLVLVDAAFRIADACPLGSAASYGVPLPLDREMTSDLLGFSRVQNNVLYANNSRGRVEGVVLSAVEQVCLTLARMAEDLILYSMPEFGWFTLPKELCSGSSIMPQKRNPDGLELVRAKAAVVGADLESIKAVTRGLPSGYNRDFQLTKAPYFRGCETGLACVQVMDLTVSKLTVNADKLAAAFTPEIFATDRALELVKQGMPFRDAYRQVGANLEQLPPMDPVEAIRRRTSTGTSGNLRLDVPRATAKKFASALQARREYIAARLRALVGRDLPFFRDPLRQLPN
jgi:argininosuccinate lyase